MSHYLLLRDTVAYSPSTLYPKVAPAVTSAARQEGRAGSSADAALQQQLNETFERRIANTYPPSAHAVPLLELLDWQRLPLRATMKRKGSNTFGYSALLYHEQYKVCVSWSTSGTSKSFWQGVEVMSKHLKVSIENRDKQQDEYVHEEYDMTTITYSHMIKFLLLSHEGKECVYALEDGLEESHATPRAPDKLREDVRALCKEVEDDIAWRIGYSEPRAITVHLPVATASEDA